MPLLHWRRRRARLAPVGMMGMSVLLGYGLVFGAHFPAMTRHRLTGRWVAYRGPHRPGDMIGPNARVTTIDAKGDPLSVVSTDGRPPIVWAFALADPSQLEPRPGRHVHAFSADLWLHPACPGPMCPPTAPDRPISGPPRALPVDVCSALSGRDLAAVLGPGRGHLTSWAPATGTCVWDNGRAAVEVEAGGPDWWTYLSGLSGVYSPPGAGADELVDTRAGIHVAVRRGPVTVVLLTYTNRSVPTWARIAQEVAAWVAAR